MLGSGSNERTRSRKVPAINRLRRGNLEADITLRRVIDEVTADPCRRRQRGACREIPSVSEQGEAVGVLKHARLTMTITDVIFAAFLQCETKAYLLGEGVPGSQSDEG